MFEAMFLIMFATNLLGATNLGIATMISPLIAKFVLHLVYEVLLVRALAKKKTK